MELKPGYKQTEIGAIPENWQKTNIDSIASSARNSIVGGPFGSNLVSADYVDFGVPVVRGQNMGERWVSGNFAFVTPEKANSLSANLARPDDIVFTQRGTLGQISIVPEKPYQRYLISQSQMKVSLNREIADPLFFYYVFSSTEQQEQIKQNTIQTGVPHINLGILREIPVQLPPLPEQRAIAAALSDTDALLSSLDRLLAKKRDIKQAVMQQLLTGKQRLLGFSEEWETKRLGDVVEIRKGQLITATSASAGTVPVIAGGKTPAYFHNRSNREGKTITVSGSGANAGYVAFYDVPIFASDCSTISEGKDYSIEFIFFQLQLMQSVIYKAQTGGAQPHIHPVDLKPIAIGCPTLPEQAAIAAVLSDMDAEIDALQRRQRKTRALKQGMMQELLTGRTRLV